MNGEHNKAEEVQKALIFDERENLILSGTFRNEFKDFNDGILDLRDISGVISNLINENLSTEEEVIQVLTMNVYNDENTKKPTITIQNSSLVYWTEEGLGFGWSREQSSNSNKWRFTLMHPNGSKISLNSTLWLNAVKNGWTPDFFDRRTASTFNKTKNQ